MPVAEVEEVLARAVHEQYVRQRVSAGEEPGAQRSLVGWDELPEEFKESSRRHARDVRQLLASAGYTVVPVSTGGPGRTLSDAELERLAEQAHQRWVEERLNGGWRLGSERDDKRKLHPDLVPWAELGEDRREIDRHLLREWPTILRAAGMKISRS